MNDSLEEISHEKMAPPQMAFLQSGCSFFLAPSAFGSGVSGSSSSGTAGSVQQSDDERQDCPWKEAFF
jgi:hypothetical protein